MPSAEKHSEFLGVPKEKYFKKCKIRKSLCLTQEGNYFSQITNDRKFWVLEGS